jgi:hypothetical protein
MPPRRQKSLPSGWTTGATLTMSYATENVTASVGLVQQLSQAKNLEELVKIQTEFVSKQLNSFHEQTKTMVEICTKAAQDATKRSP